MGFFDPITKPFTDTYSMIERLLNRGGTQVNAPQAPQIGQTSYAYTNLDALKPTADEQALEKIQQLRQLLLQQTGPSLGQMQSQATMSAGLQYDPQIAQIQALMNRAKKTTKEQQGVVKSTYEDLAKSYSGDVKNAHAEAKRARDQEMAQLQDSKNELKNSYADSMGDLRDLMKSLGIEAAAPDVLPDMTKDLTQYQRVSSQEADQDIKAINQREAGDVQYYQKGAPVARMAGAEGVLQLSKALQDYLFQQQGQLGQLQAQKQLAYQSALDAAQRSAQSQQNDTWSKLQQLARQEKDLLTPKKFGAGLSGASQYLTDQFTNNKYDRQFGVGEASRYLGILQGLITQLGGEQNAYRLSPEQMVNRAAQLARQQGISERILTRAMLTYLGKG